MRHGMIPILLDHDRSKQIGCVRFHATYLSFEFNKGVEITREQLFEIFGGAGVMATEIEEKGGVYFIRSGKLIEFSLCPFKPVEQKIE